MVTINPQPTVNKVKEAGTILANKKIYTSPSLTDKNWDICYKFNYPFNVLCNFTPTQFEHQGVKINSMEGFLQALKVKDEKTQRKICTLPGFLAKKVGNYLKRTGKFDRVTLYWQGKEYSRNSQEIQQVIDGAYKSKYAHDSLFRHVLNESKGKTLTHTIGKSDPVDTVLTEEEFITHLDNLREQGQSYTSNIKTFFRDVKNHIFQSRRTPTIAAKLSENKATFINDIFICGEKPKFKDAKELGIKNIIDINANLQDANFRANLAKEKGLQYLNITFNDHKYVKNPNDTIKKIVKMYNEGSPTYIIANDKKDANIVFGLNCLYNPKATLPDSLMFGTPQKSFVKRLVNLERALTFDDKKSLGWDKQFANKLNERYKTILEINS
ncbi:hypothetical protein IKJ53_00100 [bacterium]|nr:hypothetical protein [bacterium]